MTTERWVVVAGAAGDIGRSVCILSKQCGFHNLAVDLSEPRDNTVDEWKCQDLSQVTDKTVEDLSASIAGKAVQHCIVVVGGSSAAELVVPRGEITPIEIVRETIELNLVAPFAVLAAALGSIKSATGTRSFTVVSSLNALGGYGLAAYSAAKAGLAGLVASYAESLGFYGIRVNGVALGTTRTQNLIRLHRQAGRSTDFQAMGDIIPLGKVLTPDVAAETIWTLASRCAGVTGQILICDGGQHLRRPHATPPIVRT